MIMAPNVQYLPFQDPESGLYQVIIETPKGSRNKYSYDEERRLYMLKGVLPAGASFPYDFGFLPSTLGEDGDPLDVLLLLDEPAFPGCLVLVRIIGVLVVEQTEAGHTLRNDRFLGVSAISQTHQSLQDLRDLDQHLLKQIEHFFKSYNEIKGQEFKVSSRHGPKKAAELIKAGGKLFEQQHREQGAGKFRLE
jgi:inorganic pyrophosphatase